MTPPFVINKNDKIHKRSIKKIDAVVTGMLLGGIVASIYGIKKTNKHLNEDQKNEISKEKSQFRKIIKMLVFGYQGPTVQKKKGFFERLFKK